MNAIILASIALQCASPVSASDLIGLARADIPFALQGGYFGQVLGRHPAVASIPESGIHGAPLPSGETLRLGKVPDPAAPDRKALAFQLAPDDPKTSGSKRAEIAFAPNVEHDKVYWVAFGVYVYDWGSLAPHDASIFGTQLHSGDNSRGLSPSFAIVTRGRTFHIAVRHSDDPSPSPRNTVTHRYAQQPIPFGRWMSFAFRFRQSTTGHGFLQVWLDGRRIVDHQGSLGFHTPGHKDYLKFGYYNWSREFSSPRKVLLRSPVIAADPSGDRYRPDDFINQCITGA